jgi:two-component system sensor histidine kinase DegS
VLEPSTTDPPSTDRRARVRELLEKRHLKPTLSPEQASIAWEQERFVARARALFYARLMFLTLGLAIVTVPAWATYFEVGGPVSYMVWFSMFFYSVANYTVIAQPRVGRYVTYATLCADLMVMVFLVAKPQTGGGLQSPLLATQLLFTALFAILFPKPLGILPPLLALPITTRLDLLLKGHVTAIEILTLLWYTGLNFIVVYVLVYLNEREATAKREVLQLQGDLKELAVVEERNRLAREIHDGLGATLSSLIIQSEYLLQLAKDEAMAAEIRELKASAEESIEELRRNLRMMREDFDLSQALEDHIKTFRERTQLDVAFERSGMPERLSADAQLALFRVLQESLSNCAKHAEPKHIRVKLAYNDGRVFMSVRDDGKGFDSRASKSGHYGLLNMRERANKIGGEIIIDSTPGQGTQIDFSVPMQS